jgi:hypothetical protein
MSSIFQKRGRNRVYAWQAAAPAGKWLHLFISAPVCRLRLFWACFRTVTDMGLAGAEAQLRHADPPTGEGDDVHAAEAETMLSVDPQQWELGVFGQGNQMETPFVIDICDMGNAAT